MLLQLFILQFLKVPNAEALIATSSLIFTLPFVLFGPWAGYFSDQYSKTSIMKAVKWIEIPIMALGALGFFTSNIFLMMAVLFLMATHSTFFSPAKAGFVPEICSAESISRANGFVSMATFFAIIGGMALAGQLFNWHIHRPALAVIYCIALAVLGLVSVYFVPATQAKGGEPDFPWNPLGGIKKDLVFLKKQKTLWVVALAHSYFWLLGLVFTTNILVYGKKILLLGEQQSTKLSLLPASMGIGIAAGSLLAGRLSDTKIELKLVPWGGLGLACSGILLFLSTFSYVLTLIILLTSGIFGGLFIVPLYSYLQFEAPERERGRVLATSGVLNGFALVLGALLYRLLSVSLALPAHGIYLFMGVITLAMVFYGWIIMPKYFGHSLKNPKK